MRSHRPIIKHFNIYYPQAPDPRVAADVGAQITIGDMHANSMKFIAALEKHDILNISKEAKRTLSRIYNIPVEDLTKEDYKLFVKLIMNANVNPAAKFATLRLIGDEFADRGMGDHFTLPIIVKLGKNNIPWQACLSNHSMSLLRCYENQQSFTATDVDAAFSQSIINLEICIKKGIISRKKVNEIIKEYYLPHITLADYTINEDQSLTHYLHGRFGDNHLAGICDQLDIRYDISSTKSEIKCLDMMQSVFEFNFVRKGRISTLVYQDKETSDDFSSEESSTEEYDEIDEGYHAKSNESPVSQSIWNRNHNNISRRSHHRYVHGHDTPRSNPAQNAIELDNVLGKEPLLGSFYKKHSYEALYSHESKEMNNRYLEETESLFIHPDILALFGSKHVSTLINVDKIYSRVQIRTIKEFLCDEESINFWNNMQASICNVENLFLVKLRSDYALWDVIYILNKNQLLTTNIFELLLNSNIPSETLFQIFLVLDQDELLTEDCPIEDIFALNKHADEFYESLIEIRELHTDSASFKEILSSYIKGFHTHPDHARFNTEIYKCINTLSLVISAEEFDEFRNSEYFITFMDNTSSFENKKNRTLALYNELVSYFLAMMDPDDSQEDSLESESDDDGHPEQTDLVINLLHKFPLQPSDINKTIRFFDYLDDEVKVNFIHLLSYVITNNLHINPLLLAHAIGSPSQLIAFSNIWKHIQDTTPPGIFYSVFRFENFLPLLKVAGLIVTIDMENSSQQIGNITHLDKDQLNDLYHLINLLDIKNLLDTKRLHNTLDIIKNHPERAGYYLHYIQMDMINITTDSFDALCKLDTLIDMKTLKDLEVIAKKHPDVFKDINAELLHWVTLLIILDMNVSIELINIGRELEINRCLASISKLLHNLKKQTLFTDSDFHLIIKHSNECSEIADLLNMIAKNGHFNASIWETIKQNFQHVDSIFALRLRSAYLQKTTSTENEESPHDISNHLVETAGKLISGMCGLIIQHSIFAQDRSPTKPFTSLINEPSKTQLNTFQ